MNKVLFDTQKRYLSERLRGKSILISGASGLVGSAIVRLLGEIKKSYETDIKIVALYRDDVKLNKAVGNINELIIPVKWDSENEELHYEDRVDDVIHCAGISGGSKMKMSEPVRLYDININSTKKLLDFSVRHKASFLFASSYEIYGNLSQEYPFNEDAPSYLDTFTPRNIYAECKRACEVLCCAYSQQYGIRTLAVRLSSTFGKNVSYNDPRFFAEFARLIIENKDIVLKSKGETVRSYLDVDDAAMAMLFVMVNGEDGTAYNLTNMANAISIKDMAKKMIELSGADIELRFDIAEDIEKLGYRKEGRTLMDTKRLKQLGWEPVYSIEDTLINLLDSIKEQRENL